MSSISYQTVPGPVGDILKNASLSTTATVPVSPATSLVFTTSHIGLDLESGSLVNETPAAEIRAIFNCLDAALRNAGVSAGPGHAPTWTLVIVKEMNAPGMRAEMSAEAIQGMLPILPLLSSAVI